MHDSAIQRHRGTLLRNAQYSTERLDIEDADTLAAVRSLLVSEEQQDLKDLHDRLTRIEQTTFDRDTRRNEVAEVLGDALKQASLTDGQKIEAVLNPTIGEGIRHQLRNERPAMVAALVPMVGTLVAGAMSEAMGKLSASINDRFERLFSFSGMKLAIRARVTGRSISELLLAELRKTEVKRLYLFERQTQKLAFCWPDAGKGEDPADPVAEEIQKAVLSITSGMLDDGDHGLRSITLRDRHLVLQANDTHIVVIEVSGPLSDGRRGDLNDACFEVLTLVSDLTSGLSDTPVDQHAMGLFAARVLKERGVHKDAGKRRINPAICLAGILGLALVGYVGWQTYDGYRIEARAEAITRHIATSFPDDSLMLSVTAERATGVIAVLGVALAEGDRVAIRDQAIALARPYDLAFNLVNAGADNATPHLAALEASIGTLRDHARRTDGALQVIDTKATQAFTQADALRTASRALSDWVTSHAVFFSTGTSYRLEENTRSDLDMLATLMIQAPGRPLRITGYSDLKGSQAENTKLAIDRAEQVADDLLARGIDPSRLIVLGRIGQENVISAQNGTNSPNRRVEFALGFVGEQR